MKAATLDPTGFHSPAGPAKSERVERTRLRQLTWALGLLGVILVGQANEFSYAYLGNGRLFSLPALVLSVVILALGLQLNPRPRIGWPFGLLLMAMTYSAIVAALVSAPTASLTSLIEGTSRLTRPMFLMVCAFVGMQALANRGRISTFANICTLIAIAVVGFQVLAYLLGHEPTIHPREGEAITARYSGIFGDPNVAAGFSVLLVCIGQLSSYPRWAKQGATVLALAGVFVTFSRGGLAAFGAVVLANSVIGRWRDRYVYIGMTISVVTFVLVVIPWAADAGALPQEATRRLATLHELVTGKGDLEDNSRGQLLTKALAAIGDRPLIGYGSGEYMTVLGQGPHNMFTQFALLSGLPAMVMFAWSMLTLGCSGLAMGRDTERRYVSSVVAWTCMIGFSIQTVLDDKFSVLFITLAFAVVASRGVEDEANRPGDHPSTLLRSKALGTLNQRWTS